MAKPSKLSKRQIEYLELLVKYPGETDRRRAIRMKCSYSTCRKHADAAKKRIRASCKTEAALKYLRGEIE